MDAPILIALHVVVILLIFGSILWRRRNNRKPPLVKAEKKPYDGSEGAVYEHDAHDLELFMLEGFRKQYKDALDVLIDLKMAEGDYYINTIDVTRAFRTAIKRFADDMERARKSANEAWPVM